MSDSLFTTPKRSHIVSSARFRKFEEYTNAQFGTLYHRILGLLGDTRTLVVCNTMTNLAFARLLSPPSQGMKVVISPFRDTPVYPNGYAATCNRELGYLAAGIVGSQRLFVTPDGKVDPRVRLTRSSATAKDTSSKVWAILENELSNVLVSEVPYLVRFAALTDPGLVDLSLEIALAGASFVANSMTVIPVPIAGGITLSNITHSGANPVYSYGHTPIVKVEETDEDRSVGTFISFEPVKTTSLALTFLSDLYSSVLKCTSIGILLVDVAHNIYAQTSYVGFKVTPPQGATKITKVTTKASPFSPSLDDVHYYFYPDINSFKLMSNEFVATTGPNQFTDMPAAEYYLLVEINTKNNATPVLRNITLDFE